MARPPADYLGQVGRQWLLLIGGVVMALIGFLASATGFAVPQWLWWLLALVCFVVAQFKAWDRMRVERDELVAHLPTSRA